MELDDGARSEPGIKLKNRGDRGPIRTYVHAITHTVYGYTLMPVVGAAGRRIPRTRPSSGVMRARPCGSADHVSVTDLCEVAP